MFTIVKLSQSKETMSISIDKQELAQAAKTTKVVAQSIYEGIRTGIITAQETYKHLNK